MSDFDTILYSSFDFCEPGGDSKDKDPVENLGQVVFGERLRASAYEVREYCCSPINHVLWQTPLFETPNSSINVGLPSNHSLEDP